MCDNEYPPEGGAPKWKLSNIISSNAKPGFRATLMVHAQSKAIIEQALQNDAKFLAECNIMDYSLLVGIDDHEKRDDRRNCRQVLDTKHFG